LNEFRKAQLDLAHAAGLAFDQLKEGLFEADLDYRLVLINEHGAKLAGFDDVDSCLAAQVNIANLFVEPEDLRKILSALETQDRLEGYVCWLCNVRNEQKWIETTVNLLVDEDGERTGYWGVFRDLTPNREAEQARDRLHSDLLAAVARLEQSETLIRIKNEELESRNLDLRDYSAAVTHDLRAPLTAVKGLSEMLIDLYGKELDERGQRLLDRIRFNTIQMDRIIRGLQDLVLLGEVSEPMREVEPDRVLRTLLPNHQADLDRLKVEVDIQTDLPRIKVHPTKLFQLFDNLVTNALKHLDGVAQPRLRFGLSGPCGDGFFFIEDNGVGIEAAHRQRIFEMFYRVDRSKPGVGLGLSIVKRVVDLYQGRIWVEQVEPAGARFCFSLPEVMPENV
jgi:PAS domain S-box-containing protein